MRRVALSLMLAGIGLITGSTARTDTLTAPAQIMAKPDGSFSYPCTYRNTQGSDALYSCEWFGQVNVQGGMYADCFCLSFCPHFAPGDSFTFVASGQLTYPSRPGQMAAVIELCSLAVYGTATTIQPFDPTGIDPPAAAIEAAFWNEPNPFSARTTFHYRQPASGPVSLGIYDLSGRLVARVLDQTQEAGAHQVPWDARAALGTARGGVWFARIVIGGRALTRTLIVVP